MMDVDHEEQPSASASSSKPTSSGRIVFPGDSLSVSGTGIRLGNGLVQSSFVPSITGLPSSTPEGASSSDASSSSGAAAAAPVGHVTVTKCGLLRKGLLGRLAVDNSQRRFQAAVDDLVVGVVVEKHAESYRVEIGASQPASLPALAFEGATKRNKPNLPIGALVYARVSIAHRDIEVELSCTSPHFKKDWVTGQSLYGELLGGYAFSCSTRLARELLQENCYVLQALGKYVPFELAIGMNGRVWINSAQPLHTILLTNAIMNSEGKSKEVVTSMVQKIMAAL
jgi:exosome complex component RRP40